MREQVKSMSSTGKVLIHGQLKGLIRWTKEIPVWWPNLMRIGLLEAAEHPVINATGSQIDTSQWEDMVKSSTTALHG